MRKFSDRMHEAERVRADDRDLTSRTDLRREQQTRELELKQLSLELVSLKPAQLQRLQLDDELLEAVAHAQSLSDRKAKGRQIGVVRQQLRQQGPAALLLRERVAALKVGQLPSTPPAPEPTPIAGEELESWIERFLAEGDSGLEEFFALYPEADRQALRQGARAIARTRDNGFASGAAARAAERLREELARWL